MGLNKPKGFTLMELVVSLSILSISALFSTSYVGKFLAKNKVSSDTFLLVNLISSARNHAINVKGNTLFCSIDNNNQCKRQWDNAALIAENPDGNTLVSTHTFSGNYKNIVWSSFQRRSFLAFNSRGYSRHQNGTLYLCHKSYPELNRAIVISKSGRSRVEKAHKNFAKYCQ